MAKSQSTTKTVKEEKMPAKAADVKAAPDHVEDTTPSLDPSKGCDKHAECILALHHPGSCRRNDGTIIAKNRETVEVNPPPAQAEKGRKQKVHVGAGTMTAHNWRTAGFPTWYGYGVDENGDITHYLGDMGVVAGFQDIDTEVMVAPETIRLVFRCSRRLVELDAI